MRGGGGRQGWQHLAPFLRRGVIPCIHREATQDVTVNTVDCRWQLPRWGCSRSQGSTDHYARSHLLGVGAEGDVPIILSPKEGLRHSYCSIHPHQTVGQVAVGPPC